MALGGLLGQRAEEEQLRSPEDLQKNRNLSQLGASLIEDGFKDLGSPGTGKAVGDYLRNEWHRQEAQTFQATVGTRVSSALDENMNSYRQRTKMTTEIGVEGQDPAELRKGYYSEYDMDGAPVPTSFIPNDDPMAVNSHLNSAASDLIGNLQGLSMEYMDAAGEYPNNPLIETKAKNLMGHIQATFEGQLTAAKVSGEQMAQQDKMLDLEKKQEESRLRQMTMPTEEKIAVAQKEQELDTIERSKLQVEAMEMKGREIASAMDLDADALDREDALRLYYKSAIDQEEALKKAKISTAGGKGLLPPGVGPENLPAYMQYDPRGKAVYQNFVDEEEIIAARNPQVKDMLGQAAIELQLKNKVPENQVVPFDQLPLKTTIEGGTTYVGQDLVKYRVFVEDKNMNEQIKARSVRRSAEYFLGLPQFAIDAGIKPKGSIMGETPAIFKNSDEALRVTKPELFAEENEEKYAEKLADEEYSGDPEDPFGPPSEDPESPVSEGAPARERDEVDSWRKWYDEVAGDPDIPLKDKKKQARNAIKAIDTAIENISTRQSLDEYGLPTQQYMSEVKDLQRLRAVFTGIVTGREGEPLNETLWDDISDVWDDASETIGTLLEVMDSNHDNVIKNSATAMRYMGFDPKARSGQAVGALVDPLGALVKNRQGIIDSGVPYGMAPPEEQKRRKEVFNKGIKTGIF